MKTYNESDKVRVGDIIHAVVEDHNDATLESVDGPELMFEVFGRVVRNNSRSFVVQYWGNPQEASGETELDSNTEMIRLLKSDVVFLRRLR